MKRKIFSSIELNSQEDKDAAYDIAEYILDYIGIDHEGWSVIKIDYGAGGDPCVWYQTPSGKVCLGIQIHGGTICARLFFDDLISIDTSTSLLRMTLPEVADIVVNS